MSVDWTVAFALFLVLEGVLPFLSPATFRRSMQLFLGQPDKTLRVFGLGSMLIGVVMLYLVNS